jgi:hypothetical protein
MFHSSNENAAVGSPSVSLNIRIDLLFSVGEYSPDEDRRTARSMWSLAIGSQGRIVSPDSRPGGSPLPLDAMILSPLIHAFSVSELARGMPGKSSIPRAHQAI